MRPLASYASSSTYTPPPSIQRNGAFELYIGKAQDVEERLAQRKQEKDTVGQLSLSANVVESSNNLAYPDEESLLDRTLFPYIDFKNATRNGQFGSRASFVYPLKLPVAPHTSLDSADKEIKIGVYISGQDLPQFLNRVGEEEWNRVVKQSPDKITQYALEFAEDTPKDSENKPIHLEEVSKFSKAAPRLNRLA